MTVYRSTVLLGLRGLFLLLVLGVVLAPDGATAADKVKSDKAKTKTAAKPKPAVVKPPEVPLPPQLLYVYPAGGQRGRTVEVTVHGVAITRATAVRISGSGASARVLPPAPPPDPAGKDAKTAVKTPQRAKNPLEVDTEPLRVAVTVAADAEPGERDLRVITAEGMSNRVRFVVGQLPEVMEVEPNSRRDEAQVLPQLPVVVNGQIHPGDVDVFRFHARAGQTIVCELYGRRLMPFLAEAVPGWLQGVLTLTDASGREVGYADDFRIDPDPVLIYKVEKDGDYDLEVRDALYRGTARFVYRMTIGAVPYLTDVYPLGGRRGSTVALRLNGVNLGTDRLTVTLPADAAVTPVGVRTGGLASNRLPVAVSDVEEKEEVEPNDSREQATPLGSEAGKESLPAAPTRPPAVVPPRKAMIVNGRIDRPGDVDWFVFTTKGREAVVLEVMARRLGSPLDSHLTVFDAQGRQLAINDDTPDEWAQEVTHHADSRLLVTCPTAGKYYVRLIDVQSKGGKEFAYRLSLSAPQPDFRLRFSPDQPSAGGGDCAVLKIEAVRRDNFFKSIDLEVRGLPKGFAVPRATLQPGQPDCVLAVPVPPGSPLALVPLTVVGTAEIDGQTVTRQAVPAEELQQAFAYLHRLPTRDSVLAVTGPATLFTLSAPLPPGGVLEIPANDATRTGKARFEPTGKVTVKIHRQPDGLGYIRFTNALGAKNREGTRNPLPQMVTVNGNAARDESEATINLTPLPRAVPGKVYDTVISAALRVGKEDIIRSVVIPIKIAGDPKAPATPPPATPRPKPK